MGCSQSGSKGAVQPCCSLFRSKKKAPRADIKDVTSVLPATEEHEPVEVVEVTLPASRPVDDTLQALSDALGDSQGLPQVWWSHSSANVDSPPDPSLVEDDVLEGLHGRPNTEVLARLTELRHRPWQALWRRLIRDYPEAAKKLNDQNLSLHPDSPAQDTTEWENACRILVQAASGGPVLEDIYGERAKSALSAALQAKQRLLKLQEQLCWLAQVIVIALAFSDQRTQLLQAIHHELTEATAEGMDPERFATGGKSAEELSKWLSDGPEDETAKLMWLARAGFELRGVRYRLIESTADWRLVCAEVHCCRLATRADAAVWGDVEARPPRLIVALEGLGLRLLASPLLPTQSTAGEKMQDNEIGSFALAERRNAAIACLERWGIDVPEDPLELRNWCTTIPNPRNLLSLAFPLKTASARVDALYATDHRTRYFTELCVAVCFAPGTSQTGPVDTPLPAELLVGDCMSPTLVCASTTLDLLEKIATVLRCTTSELQQYAPDRLSKEIGIDAFGCSCDVWYRPTRGDEGGNGTGGNSIWSWGSEHFALVLQAPSMPSKSWAESVGAPPLETRLQKVRQRIVDELRFLGHPSSVRSALRSCGVPSRFRVALPLLDGNGNESLLKWRTSSSSSNAIPLVSEALDEAVGADALGASAKHLVRGLCTMAMRGSSTESDSSILQRSALFRGVDASETPDAAKPSQPRRSETLGAIESEPPIPPLPPKVPIPAHQQDDVGAQRPATLLSTEVGNLFGALELHSDLDRAWRTQPGGEQQAAARLGLLFLVFWTRLVAGAREVLHHTNGLENGFDLAQVLMRLGQRLLRAARRAPVTLAHAVAAHLRVQLNPTFLRRVRLPNGALNKRPMRGSAQASEEPQKEIKVLHSCSFHFCAAIAFEDASADCYRLLEAAEARRSNGVGSFRPPFRVAGDILLGEDLDFRACWCHRSPEANDVACEGRAPFPRSASAGGGLDDTPEKDKVEPYVNGVNHADTEVKSPSSFQQEEFKDPLDAAIAQSGPKAAKGVAQLLAAATSASHQLQDDAFLKHRGQRVRDLLRCAQWLLLSYCNELYEKHRSGVGRPKLPPMPGHERATRVTELASFTPPPRIEEGDDGRTDRAASLEDVRDPEDQLTLKILSTVRQILQVASTLVGGMSSCPPELLIALWTIRGYTWEKQDEVDVCFVDYLQALSTLEETWGDPRKRGGRGHPFALLLTWKLGLISYCRGDVKSIDKFADYFRSLMLYYSADCPFAWGPPAVEGGEAPAVGRQGGFEDHVVGSLLWSNEAPLWLYGSFWRWWLRHDALNFGISNPALSQPLYGSDSAGSPPESPDMLGRRPSGSGRVRPQSDQEGGIASDLQEVRRGTVFGFGSNQLGQLGIGRPLLQPLSLDNSKVSVATDVWWSGRPVRLMVLKENRIAEIACGEEHCAAIDIEGQLFLWGNNEFLQVGTDRQHAADSIRSVRSYNPPPTNLPICLNPLDGSQSLLHQPTGQVLFVAVACGAQFSCALDSHGHIWVWGVGEGGVLGLGNKGGLEGRAQPTLMEALQSTACKLVDCGAYHSMALTKQGELYSWGRAEGGQLGLSEERVAQHIEELELEDSCVCLPLRVLFREDGEDNTCLAQVSCGDVHSCGLDTEGQVWSWGWGEFGQLGIGISSAKYEVGIGGSSSKRLTPQLIPSRYFDFAPIRSVACGGAFSAAVVDLPPTDTPGFPSPNGQITPPMGYTGNLYLWGANENGQCGLPPRKPNEVDIPTKAKSLAHTVVRSVACGATHAVAIDMSGRAYSWGNAQYGQLGSMSPPKVFTPPPAIDTKDPNRGLLMHHQPTLIQSVSRLHIMKAACGLYHSLLLSEPFGVGGVPGRGDPDRRQVTEDETSRG